VPALTALCSELRELGARAERAVNPVSTPDLEDRLRAAIDHADMKVVVACADGQLAGMAVFRAVQPDPLSGVRVLQMSNVIVAPGFRRRGVGHALIAAAADAAEDLQLEHVGVGVYPSLRDVSRFYARMGFAQVMLQRVVPVAVLRRRLGTEPAVARVEELVRRRTRMRRPVPAQRPARAAKAAAETVD
jgi:predicted N-acetyltransferase YhbS